MSERRIVGPTGLVFIGELSYTEGELAANGARWRGWHFRFHLAGEHIPLSIFLEGPEEVEPHELQLADAADDHYERAVAATRRLPRWQREILDPVEMTELELRQELDRDLRVRGELRDSRHRRLLELRVEELARELERRDLPIPPAVLEL